MKSFLMALTLLTLTACCGCMDKPMGKMANGSMSAPASANTSCNTVKVTGMTCEACAMTVSTNLKKLHGVKDVQVNVANGTVKIFTDKKTTLKSSDVQSIIEKSGYTFNSLQAQCN